MSFLKIQLKPSNIFLLSLILFFSQAALATNDVINIDNGDAKKMYNALTGSKIQNDAAMSHTYRRGRGVQCQYVNADMSIKGKNILPEDAKRYHCEIHFNENGMVDNFR